jgi:hypothetical protein
VKHHVFWVCHSPLQTHTQMTHCTPPWTRVHPNKPVCTHQSSCLLDQCAPSLGACPLPCAFSCVNCCDSSWVCRWGHPTSLVHPCFKGRWVHSLGMLPSFPALSQMQPKSLSIILRKVRCVPPWCRMSPSCTQGTPAHTHRTTTERGKVFQDRPWML